jgi:hypothetical protein
MTLRDIVTLSTGAVDDARAVFVQVRTAILDHHFDHHWGLSRAVLTRSCAFCIPIDLRKRTLADDAAHAAYAWGSRGRRFDHVSPTVKPQVRGGSVVKAGSPLA